MELLRLEDNSSEAALSSVPSTAGHNMSVNKKLLNQCMANASGAVCHPLPTI